MKSIYLIGYPLTHSISAVMQNAALRAHGIESEYRALAVAPKQLGPIVKVLRGVDCVGANVTIPHKREVIPLMDELSPEANEIGAVNTVVRVDGRLRGENTDATGFLQSMRAEGIQLRDRRAFVIGAGGAAAAVSWALAREQVSQLILVNRTADRADALAARLRDTFPNSNISVNPWSLFDQADLIINATPLGMAPAVDETPVSGRPVPKGAVAIDLVYNPRETRFLREARAAGARGIGGLGMLVYQGARSFELWTGKPAPTEIMKAAAEQALAGMSKQIETIQR